MPHPRGRIRVKVNIQARETILNQCAHAALERGRGFRWFEEFLVKAHQINDLDDYVKLLLTEFDIVIEE